MKVAQQLGAVEDAWIPQYLGGWSRRIMGSRLPKEKPDLKKKKKLNKLCTGRFQRPVLL